MADPQLKSTTSTAGLATLAGGAVVLAVAAVFRWAGAPAVASVVLGAALVLCGIVWLRSGTTPRTLPTVTAGLGMLLAVAPLLLRYRNQDALAAAYLTHILVGLAMAAVGVWAGKRLRAPRADRL